MSDVIHAAGLMLYVGIGIYCAVLVNVPLAWMAAAALVLIGVVVYREMRAGRRVSRRLRARQARGA